MGKDRRNRGPGHVPHTFAHGLDIRSFSFATLSPATEKLRVHFFPGSARVAAGLSNPPTLGSGERVLWVAK